MSAPAGPVGGAALSMRPLSLSQELAAVGMFVRRDFLLRTHFTTSFVTGLFASLTPLLIFGMIAHFGARVPELDALAGGYVNFVLSGMVINALLAGALAGPYRGLMDSFWNDRLEILMASAVRLPVFTIGVSAGSWVQVLSAVVVYLAGGTLLLGFDPPALWRWSLALLVAVPALVATTGLGLAAASSVFTLDARGGQDPVRFFVEALAGLVAGVYFPLSRLPEWAQWLGHLVPHTYAVDGFRRALFGADSVPPLLLHGWSPLPPLATDLLMLCLYAAVALPVGWRLFQYGLDLARGDGRLSRWQ